MRKALIERNTKETAITVEINLDGQGEYEINTGIGFLDHMLEQFSRHSLIDMKVTAKGDTHIDYHHTTEDTGIAIGECLAKALGDKRGINRYAHMYIPMDETLSRVSLDLSNRPYLIWNVNFTIEKITSSQGDFDTELFREWFQAFAQSSGTTLHVENIYGTNNHHIIESCYKALARSLRLAISVNERVKHNIPSTKGEL